jgi:2-(1,2-epoxy-1,2-dihydrophenyl)acetyl-CoA isomerase
MATLAGKRTMSDPTAAASPPATLYKAENGVATILLNRPERLNAFNAAMFAGIREGLDLAEADESVRVVVFTGAGRAFSSGQDLTEKLPMGADGKLDLGPPLARDYNPLALRLVDYPKITVAALNGPAVGAAANLALSCDIAVATRSAYIQQAFARIGLAPDAGGTWLLPRIVGMKRALALALTGDRLAAEEALAIGLVYRVFEDATFAADLAQFVAPFASGPAVAYKVIKQAFAKSLDNDFATQLALESDLQQQLGKTDDFMEAVMAFAMKRPPAFKGQ